MKGRILQIRGTIEEQKAKLRRARRIYFRLICPAVMKDETNFTLNFCVNRLRNSGLYASTAPDKDLRYTILRHAWKMDTRPWGWHEWVAKNGFARFKFQRMAA